MQKYKKEFKDTDLKDVTVGNLQSCIRLKDFDIIGDGTHSLYFTMMGFFSFRGWSVNKTVDFWLKFLETRLNLSVDVITVHPDKSDWLPFYPPNKKVKFDDQCIWSDGDIGGYCTEFYVNDIEIGNIVNPLNTCIDVGFGLERISMIVNGTKPLSRQEEFVLCCIKMIESGIKVSPKNEGYVLRKILREIVKLKGSVDHKFFYDEVERQMKMQDKYNYLKSKNDDMPDSWWWNTHGVDFNFVEK